MKETLSECGLRWRGKDGEVVEQLLSRFEPDYLAEFKKEYKWIYRGVKKFDENDNTCRRALFYLFQKEGDLYIESAKKAIETINATPNIKDLSPYVIERVPLTFDRVKYEMRYRDFHLVTIFDKLQNDESGESFREQLLPGYKLKNLFAKEEAKGELRKAYREHTAPFKGTKGNGVFKMEESIQQKFLNAFYETITKEQKTNKTKRFSKS